MKWRDNEVGLYFPTKYQKENGTLSIEFEIPTAIQVQQSPFHKDGKLLLAVQFSSVADKIEFLRSYNIPEDVEVDQ